jgi:hypothetical protein
MALAEKHYPLIEAAQSGDPAALGRLLRVCQPDIRRYAQRNCLMSDVDDAVQETLVILSRRVQSVRVLVALFPAGCSLSCGVSAGAWSGSYSASNI